jgi:ATP-dependent RNA helicase DBP3
VISTPGRLLDLLQEGYSTLEDVSFLVLDEADRMLDLGFAPDIRALVEQIKITRKQTVMFSATWPVSIRNLASEYLQNPIKITVGSDDVTANHSVKQIVEVLEPHEKDNRLLSLLNKYHASGKNKVLVFVLYKKEASRVEYFLQKRGWPHARAIQGDMSQAARTEVMTGFKDGSSPLLIATDVAARGLDINNVEYVINYTFPLTIEDYVHRIGRTGRAGKTGCSHTFFTFNDKARAGELVKVLKEAGQEVSDSLSSFDLTIKKKEHSMYGSHFKDNDRMPDITKKVHVKYDD